jgi:hypothetical protein
MRHFQPELSQAGLPAGLVSALQPELRSDGSQV